MPRYLVLLETAGNQDYIFSTNKLRENVGASQLTYASCKTWVNDALPAYPGCKPVLRTSGKAYVTAPDAAAAKGLIQTITTRALRDAPGLDLSGVFVPYRTGELCEAIRKIHRLLASRKGQTPGPACRFLRLPVVAECGTSGLPAAVVEPDPDGREVMRSAVACAKLDRGVLDDGIGRMRRIARANGGHEIVRNPDDLDRLEGVDWLGVVHADVNDLGRVFHAFPEYADTPSDDDHYGEQLSAFSEAVDAAAERAFGAALTSLQARIDWVWERDRRQRPEFLPVAPILLGGDDLTVVMDGEHAVRFADDYLKAFERETADQSITAVMRRSHPATEGRVTACAGVAVVKPHYPFSAAYQLAEELTQSAKDYAKSFETPRSGIDFHILYDASGTGLKRIRESLTADSGETRLTARPYLATAGAGPRTTATLGEKVAAVRAKDEEGRRLLPNSMLHELRASLFLGRGAANHTFNLVRHRYPGFTDLFGPGTDGMFFRDGREFRTHLLDALDLVGFWPEDRP